MPVNWGTVTQGRTNIPAVATNLDKFFSRALSREPGERFQSARELAAAFISASDTNTGAQSVKILVVDDEPVNLEVARMLLSDPGLEVDTAENGEQACAMAAGQPYVIILMDMQMPVMGGIEATESIRAREMRRSWVISDQFTSVCIIAMTANAMEGDRDRCLRAGMNDYVAKPIKAQELYAAIDRSLGRDSSQGPTLAQPESLLSRPSERSIAA
jgi:protein-histidine pros-kinase